MKAEDFDRKFDQGEDITAYLDLSQAKRPLKKEKLSVHAIEIESKAKKGRRKKSSSNNSQTIINIGKLKPIKKGYKPSDIIE